MMINRPDALLDFGALKLASDAAFSNTLDLNKAQSERMKVEVSCAVDAAGGTSVELKLQGSDNNSAWTDISTTGAIVLAKLKAGATFTLPIPDGCNFRYLKVSATKSGTFTAGEMTAGIDTYLGI